jgi:hypothetical protein
MVEKGIYHLMFKGLNPAAAGKRKALNSQKEFLSISQWTEQSGTTLTL